MAVGFSTQDLDLLGYERSEEIRNEKGWNAYRANATLGIETVESVFVYLKTDCLVDEARAAGIFLRSQKPTVYVLYPASIKLVLPTIEQVFQAQAGRIFNLESLVWRRLQGIFGRYIEDLESGIPREENFVTPRREGADPHTDLEKDLVLYFDGKGNPPPGNLLVVKAPAGVGKTTLARHAVLRLIGDIQRYKSIPVFVESSHWRKLKLDSIDELWEIIQNSLQAFGSSSPINKDLFEYALRQGYLVFIFDGFDELCGNRTSNFDPNQLLASIASIAAASDARIVLTTRSLYWNSAISNPPPNVVLVELAAFNKQQAVGYFEKVFSGDKKKLQDKARELYEQVQRGSSKPRTSGGGRAQFVNLPLCVVMIAELVAQRGVDARAPSENVLEDLILQICDRECERQNIRTSKGAQLAAFETLVCDRDFIREQSPEFDVEFLGMAGIASEDLESVRSHGLLADGSDGRLRFKYEFLPSYLRAVALRRILAMSGEHIDGPYWELMANEANGKSYLLEHMVELTSLSDWRTAIRNAASKVPVHLPEARSFLFHLARNLLEEEQQIVTKQDLTDSLLSIFNPRFSTSHVVSGLTLLGSIQRLNLSGVTLQDCSFVDVSFLATEADESTRFIRCRFRGVIEFPEGKQWKTVGLIEPQFLDPTASMCWESLLGQTHGSKVDSVTESVRYAFQKFWHNGHLKANLRRNDWNKGPLSHSPYKTLVLDAMLKFSVLSEEDSSSVEEGVLRFNRDNLQSLQRFMDNRQKTGVVLDVIEHIMSKA